MSLTTPRSNFPRLAWIAFLLATLSTTSCNPAVVSNGTPTPHATPVHHRVLPETPTDEEVERALLFGERLVPLGVATTPAENRALASAIAAYFDRDDRFNTGELEAFLRDHPATPWRASLLTNLGLIWRETGRYGEALTAWQTVWSLLQADRTWNGYATADRAVSELALLNAQLGRDTVLQALFTQLARRPAVGAAAERITRAQRGLGTMRAHPEVAYRCGPFAVLNVRRVLQSGEAPVAPEEVTSTSQGTSLAQLVALAAQWGEPMVALRRPSG